MDHQAYADNYHQARQLFMDSVRDFATQQELNFEQHREVMDNELDLSIDSALYIPPGAKRVFLCISGTHGIEGFTGNAIQRELMKDAFGKIDFRESGLCLIHGLNPWGFHHFRRVNRANVDLNRNFEVYGEALYSSDSDGYLKLASVLSPQESFAGGAFSALAFYGKMLSALLQNGMGALRQAILSGQYDSATGIFFGGHEMQPESKWFSDYYQALLARVPELLLVDLHTGYGERGLAYPLFGQADSPNFKQYTDEGVKTDGGQDKTYTARGELVRFCYETSKQKCPEGTFNGLVLEMGTHGLKIQHQLSDLQVVVGENQVHHHGALREQDIAIKKAAFRELFYPSQSDWREAVLAASKREILGFLEMGNFLKSA